MPTGWISTPSCRCFSLLLLVVSSPLADAIRWLALSRVASTGPSLGLRDPSICGKLGEALVKRQKNFCLHYPNFMESVIFGAIAAIDECQFQFRSRRWNCSTLEDSALMAGVDPEDILERDADSSSASTSVHVLNDSPERNTTGSWRNQVITEEDEKEENEDGEMRSRKRKRGGRRKRKMRKMKRSHGFGPFPVVPKGTREMAFVHAISAAGVAHAVTRACASGSLTTCGCDANIQGREHDRAFRWSGCSHNINYGSKFSKSFVDARELRSRKKFKKRNLDNGEEDDHRRRTSIILMNLHNNEAGRQVIQKNMKKECKCHGVSGSCELKTCWRVMPTFRQVGELLRDKYDGAVEVRGEPVGNEILLVPRNQQFKPQAREDLVYIKRSPDFCELDLKKGSLGTRGRSCNKGSRGIDGCDLLCCNRGYKTRRHKIAERCNCKFWWCCQVKCQTCEREIEIHTCL